MMMIMIIIVIIIVFFCRLVLCLGYTFFSLLLHKSFVPFCMVFWYVLNVSFVFSNSGL